jgi:hypothetical protein
VPEKPCLCFPWIFPINLFLSEAKAPDYDLGSKLFSLKPKLDHFNIYGILSQKQAHRRSWASDVNCFQVMDFLMHGDAS